MEPGLIRQDTVIEHIKKQYGLVIMELRNIPYGADQDACAFHAIDSSGASYFVKFRKGVFDEVSIRLPKFLNDHGIPHIIAPYAALNGDLWSEIDDMKVILYPFVSGKNGYETGLSEEQWSEFGMTLKRIHSMSIPQTITNEIHSEKFSPNWRNNVSALLTQLHRQAFSDKIAQHLVSFLLLKHDIILHLTNRANQYAQLLSNKSGRFVVCHADLHPGNILIATSGAFYIVDWDNPMRAPIERDLMFIGGGLGFAGATPDFEYRYFYKGYGQTTFDPMALAYFRYERIIQDIVLFSEHIFETHESDSARDQSLQYLMDHFLPGSTVETALAKDVTR